NQLTNLILPNDCSGLTKLDCSNNQLIKLSLAVLNKETLKELDISNNNFSPSVLSIFTPFTNLEILKIGNDNTKKIKQNIYNRFQGSLEPLRNLIKLRELHISNTDLNEVNIEQLPQSLEKIEYSTDKRPDCKLKQIATQLSKYQKFSTKYPAAKADQTKVIDFSPKSNLKKISQQSVKNITLETEKPQLSYSTKKNNEELLKEIATANNLAKETFWQQTISGLEKQINLLKLNIENYLQEISQLQKDFTKLQTNLTQLYELQKELGQLQLEKKIEDNAELEKLRKEFANQNEESDEEVESPNENYPQEERENTKELHISKNLEGELDLSEFTNLKKIYISYFVDEDELEIKDKGKYEDKFVKLVNAQEYLEKYLEEKYPGKEKSEITGTLYINDKNLEDDLKIEGFSSLEKLDCNKNKLTSLEIIGCPRLKMLHCGFNQLGSLDLTNCEKLEELNCTNNKLASLDLSNLTSLKKFHCQNNFLTDIDYSVLNSEELIELKIGNNNLSEQDLEEFSGFTNLQVLWIGNNSDYDNKIDENKYNRFVGSLKPLEKLTKLRELEISNTDIDSGLEYLPESVKTLKCEVVSDEFQTEKKKEKNEKINCLLAGKLVNKRKDITKLDISGKSLEGLLKLNGFVGLKELNCSNNKLTGLDLSFCSKLSRIQCSSNELNDNKFLVNLPNLQNLIYLDISDNNFQPQNLSFLEKLTNLEELRLGTSKKERVRGDKYNRLTSSLESLKSMKKLKILDISNTDIENGLDSLPKNVEEIYCSTKERPESRVGNISNLLKEKKSDFAFIDETELNIGKKLLEGHLSLKGFNNLERLYCHDNYLTDINSLLSELNPEKLKSLSLYDNNFSESDLEPFSEFVNLEVLIISGNLFREDHEQDIANRFVGSLQPLQKLIGLKPGAKVEAISAQLRDYGSDEREKIKKLNIVSKGLEGSLNTSSFKDLTDLNCSKNKLTSLDINDCLNLKVLNCENNQITKLDLTGLNELENLSCNDNLIKEFDAACLNPEKLTNLSLKNNFLSEQNISVFSKFTKLKELSIGNDNKEKIDEGIYNRFVGSLNSLKDLTKLESLHISNTDINEVDIEKLPKSLKVNGTYCSATERPENKVKDIQEKLYNYLTKKRLNEMYPDRSAKALDNLRYEELKGHLDLSEYRSLEELNCSNNQLTSLDISKNTKLKKINCSNNQFTTLNLENLPSLTEFNCSNNDKLTEVQGIEDCNELVSLDSENNSFPGETKKMLEKLKSAIEFTENKGKKRRDIKELDISGEELTGELNLKGFDSLKHLICRDNQLISIDLSECKELEIIDCRRNKLKKIKFSDAYPLKLKKFRGSDNAFKKLKSIISNIDTENLTYFDVSNNEISGGKLNDFAEFKNLKSLFIGSNDGDKSNKFTGSLEDLKELNELLEIDIRQKVYYVTKKENKANTEGEKDGKRGNFSKDGEQKNDNERYYVKENNFYDIKNLRSSKISDGAEVKVILKTPLLSEDKKHKIGVTKDSYEFKEELSLSDLPLRLCHISGKAFELFSIKKYFEKNGIESVSFKDKVLTVDYDGKEKKTFSGEDISKELQEIKNYLQKNREETIRKRVLDYNKETEIAIKKRVDPENAEKRLSPGGIKSLDKAIKTLRVLNEFHGLSIKGNTKEKGHEVSKMRDYYGNATVTLIAIHAEVGEKNIRDLLKSFDKGESGLIYPNEIIKNSLPILEKIIGSE
ncbi:31313_t:CDS:10, partial [Racocetra persica]